jgi:predicted enzyme related to lactoylglutathione lyase
VTIGGGGRRAAPASLPSTDPTEIRCLSVEDTDATVAKSGELGAMTIRPAEDNSYERMAVLADPAGAALAVIRLAPG